MRPTLSSTKFLLMVTSAIVLIMVITFFLRNDNPNEDSTIFGEIKVKSSQEVTKNKLSNYHSIKQEKGKPVNNQLRYKVKVQKENPFLSLYHEKQKVAVPAIVKIKPSKKQATETSREKSGFFSIKNTDLQQEKKVFKAIFRETQKVKPGKSLRIILQESMPTLHLKAGTILKGVPTFVGERIIIQITAGIVGKDIFKLDLRCYDQEDYIEGLYHDVLAKQLEEAAKEGLLDEVLDLDFKGNRLARKANNLIQISQNITIEKGREVFIAIPQKKE